MASDLGRGKFLALIDLSGFVVENHSTPWASGSSAASLAHWSAISFPSIPWWLRRYQISIFTFSFPSISVAYFVGSGFWRFRVFDFHFLVFDLGVDPSCRYRPPSQTCINFRD